MAETDASDKENGKRREEGREGYGTEGMGNGFLEDGEVDHSFEIDVLNLERRGAIEMVHHLNASCLVDICW